MPNPDEAARPDLQRRTGLMAALGAIMLAACGGGQALSDDTAAPMEAPPPPIEPAPATIGWQDAVELRSPVMGGSVQPRLAFNSAGDAVAVLVDSGNDRVIAYRRTTQARWLAPFDVDHTYAHYLHAPSVAVDGSGHAIVVWLEELSEQGQGSGAFLLSRRFAPSGESLEFQELQDYQTTLSGFPSHPMVVTNAEGHAMAIWRESFAGAQIRANAYTPDQGWQPTFDVISDLSATNLIGAPLIAIDRDGAALAVWIQKKLGVESIMVRAYVAGAWTDAPREIASYNANFATILPTPLCMAIGQNGKAIVAWAQRQADGKDRVMACRARHFGAGRWESVETIQTDATGDSFAVQACMDAFGRATVVWQQRRTQQPSGHPIQHIESNHFDGTAWCREQRAVNRPDTLGSDPHIACNEEGRTVVVWRQVPGKTPYSSLGVVHASHLLTPDSFRWSEPERVDIDGSDDSLRPRVVMNAHGAAIAIWTKAQGAQSRLISNEFRPTP
jgi:hypothetical protein